MRFLPVLKALEQSLVATKLPFSCSVSHMCSTPGTATPNCLTSQLTSPNRGHHCHIASFVASLTHGMPTKVGGHFKRKAVRFDCKNSYQTSGRNASCSSTILQRRVVRPRPNYSCPMSVNYSRPMSVSVNDGLKVGEPLTARTRTR